ncbi:hypothetical protein GYH30_033083 [Glycine max]|nr:hypothetical protein GYH30_033083 [Glycine max]
MSLPTLETQCAKEGGGRWWHSVRRVQELAQWRMRSLPPREDEGGGTMWRTRSLPSWVKEKPSRREYACEEGTVASVN